MTKMLSSTHKFFTKIIIIDLQDLQLFYDAALILGNRVCNGKNFLCETYNASIDFS